MHFISKQFAKFEWDDKTIQQQIENHNKDQTPYMKLQIQLRLIVLTAVLYRILGFEYTCQFGSLYKNQRAQPYMPPEASLTNKFEEEQYMQQQGRVRNLQTLVRQQFRITLDSTDMQNAKTPTNAAATATLSQRNFITKAMKVAQRFYELRLKVSQAGTVFAPNDQCVDFTVPSSDHQTGIGSSDLHIYVRFVSDGSIGYAATGKSCNYITGIALPDTTLQLGRPTCGRVLFNTHKIFENQTTLTNRLFASTVATSLHQVLHILGFDSSLFSTFLDSRSGANYGKPYNTAVTGSGPTTTTATLHASRSQSHLLLTPNVVAWAKQFFDCNSLVGMQLQNQDGGAVGSHWERLVMYDQLMTGTQLGAQKGFSGLTFSLMKDMGWYQVDGTFNDTTNYGYKQGCTFYTNGCYGTSYPKYFCDSSALDGVAICASNFLGKAICSSQPALMADNCGMFASFFNCVDPAQIDDGYKSLALEDYETDAFCVQSTFGSYPLSSNLLSRCYRYTCHSVNSSIVFHISTYTVTCASAQAGTNKTLSGLQGYLSCPVYQDFCVQARKICPNWCSQNGFCTRGICNCLPGFSGQDCSKTICTATQYYNPGTSSCTPSCPSGTYSNIYSRTCMPCQSGVCGQCRNQPQICTGCPPSTPPKVFYQSQCIATCPDSTYENPDNQCVDCDITVDCATCQFQATNCTSCLNSKYLSAPTHGTCGLTCSGFYPYYDTVKFKCASSCADNLIDGGSNTCVLCPDGTYKKLSDGNCHASCGPGFYENIPDRFCQACHQTCNTCFGGQYPQNCTSCKTDRTQKYLLLKMCLSICPRGLYANDTSGACEVCPVDLFCSTCKIVVAAAVCTSCKYGYFFQADETCKATCDQYFFKNLWNHSCDPCSLDCGDCENDNETSCINCRGSKRFLSNMTGGYCIDACPTQGYVRQGDICQPCHFTCESCNGITATDCFQCKDGLYKSSGICRYVCPQSTYADKTTKTCAGCDGSCTFCFGPTIKQCSHCVPGMFLDNTTCTATCPGNLTVNKWNVCFASKTYAFMALLLMCLLIV